MLKLVLFLHVIGATIWTGGHLVLSLTVLPRALRRKDPEIIRQFEEGYERIGIPALLVQVVTGLWLAHRLLPDVGQWFTLATPIGTMIVIKLGLLLATLLLAMHARFRIIPTLSQQTLQSLAWHIAAVTVVSVLFVLIGVAFRTGGLW